MDQRIPQIRFSAAPPFVPPTSNRWDSRKCIAASTTRRLAHHCIHAAGTRKGTQYKNLRLSLMDGENTVSSDDAAEIQSQVAYPTNSVRAPLDKLVERVRRAARDDDSGFLQRQMERAQRDLPELDAKAGQPFPKADELATKRARLKELVSVLEPTTSRRRRPASRLPRMTMRPTWARLSRAWQVSRTPTTWGHNCGNAGTPDYQRLMLPNRWRTRPNLAFICVNDTSTSASWRACKRSNVRQCMPLGLGPLPFRMPGSQPSRSRSLSACRVARLSKVSRSLR